MDSLNNLFDVLRKERRRYVLYYLDAEDRPVPIDELVEQIANWTTDADPHSIPDEKYDRTEIELTHADLPKLSEEPYVHYNRDTGHIELTQPPPAFKAIISIAEVIERPRDNSGDLEEE